MLVVNGSKYYYKILQKKLHYSDKFQLQTSMMFGTLFQVLWRNIPPQNLN